VSPDAEDDHIGDDPHSATASFAPASKSVNRSCPASRSQRRKALLRKRFLHYHCLSHLYLRIRRRIEGFFSCRIRVGLASKVVVAGNDLGLNTKSRKLSRRHYRRDLGGDAIVYWSETGNDQTPRHWPCR